MPRIDGTTIEQRKERILMIVGRNSRGITEAEITSEINLHRRTVNNHLRELEYEGKIVREHGLWYPLRHKETRLRPFELSPEEAVTLYLGARLLVKQHDKRNEPAETALLKLAQVLKSDAGVGSEIEQAARELARRPAMEGYQPIFRTIVQGYIYRKRVAIRYRPLKGKPFETSFATYLLEPSLVGFATYMIGHSRIVDHLRAYKLERVQEARLTSEDYTIPADFPGLDILHNAWSIIMGDEVVSIVLRFSPNVKERVLETRWHHSQETCPDPERPGYLLWKAQVADTKDMLPWVKGWGADCEVLEPKELRETLMGEARRLARIYGWDVHQENQPPSGMDFDDQRFQDIFG